MDPEEPKSMGGLGPSLRRGYDAHKTLRGEDAVHDEDSLPISYALRM